METCEQCGEEFQQIGGHWSKSSTCSYPPLTQRQYEICIGLLMGDGSIGAKHSVNQYIQVAMIKEKYLEYINEIFGKFGTSVFLRTTAEQEAQQNRESGFRPDAKQEDYSDIYYWSTRTHPTISELTSWYSSGEKIWPEDIDLTPTVLKHWFVGDGHFQNSNYKKHIEIVSSKEADNEEKVVSYFEDAGLPRPNTWNITERDNGRIDCKAIWNVRESEELWEYMLSDGHGIPPGFEYKWPVEYHDDHTITVEDLDSTETAVA